MRGNLRGKSSSSSLTAADQTRRCGFSRSAGRATIGLQRSGGPGTDRLTRAIKLFNQAALDLRGGWQPQLPLELALVESLQQPAASAAVAAATRKPAPAVVPSQSAAKTPGADPAKAQPAAKTVQPAVAVPAAPPAASHEATQSLTLEQVLAVWDGVLSSIKARSIPAEALLKNCHVSSVEHGTVVLELADG